jgi:hypothetical protein
LCRGIYKSSVGASTWVAWTQGILHLSVHILSASVVETILIF